MPSRTHLLFRAKVLIAAALLVFASTARADAFPSKPIKIIVPWPAGGPGDVWCRPVADAMSKQFGQAVLVENRPGATATIGAGMVAKAKPDGYTLLLASAADQALVPASMDVVPYDAARDFVAIGEVGRAPFVLAVSSSLGVKSLSELVAKSRTTKLAYGSSGPSAMNHFVGELLDRSARLDMLHVPYKGQAAILPDLLGGRVQLAFMSQVSVAQHLKAGTLHALFVTSERRLAALPDVPTAEEVGYPNIVTSFWFGLVAPAKTPEEAIARLRGALAQALATPSVRAALEQTGAEVSGATGEQFSVFMQAERAKWQRIVQETGIRASE
jgi:tripartite-type tricarboxylate transporter receptor subunit TctC